MIQSSAVPYGATWTPSGGSTVTFVSSGKQVKDGAEYVVSGDTDLLLRRSLQVRTLCPLAALNSSGFDRLQRNWLLLRVPYVSATGKQYTQPLRIETAFHSAFTSKAETLSLLAGLLIDADLQDFWNKQLNS